jgi:hypothetical protein
MGTPTTASVSSDAACSPMIGMIGPTLGSARTATPAGSACHVLRQGQRIRRARPRRAVGRADFGPLRLLRGHRLPPVRARRAKRVRTRVRRRHLHVQRRGLRAGRPALACADSAGRVEVRPARPLAPKPSSDGSAGSFLPPQALAAAVATEVHPHAARRRWCPCDTTQQQQSTTTQWRVCGPG